MGTPKKRFKKAPDAPTATELCAGDAGSEAYRSGRRLKLWFVSGGKPELDRVEFHCNATTKFAYLQQRDRQRKYSFTWTKVPQALSLCFLAYLRAGLEGESDGFYLRGARNGSHAASLGDAICKNSGKIYDLFTEYLPTGGEISRIQSVFDGRKPV